MALTAQQKHDLVTGLQAGDELAGDDFVIAFSPLITVWVSKFGIDKQRRNDAVQSTFWSAFANIEDLRNPQSLVTWVYRVTQTECRNFRKANLKMAALDDENCPSPEKVPVHLSAEHSQTMHSKVQAAAKKEIASDDWGVFTDFRTTTMTIADVAKKYGIPKGRVKAIARKVQLAMQDVFRTITRNCQPEHVPLLLDELES